VTAAAERSAQVAQATLPVAEFTCGVRRDYNSCCPRGGGEGAELPTRPFFEVIIALAVGTVAGALAYFMYPHKYASIAYICTGLSPTPLQAVQLVESGQLQRAITYNGWTACVSVGPSPQQLQYLKKRL
jgi:hypothetical protein